MKNIGERLLTPRSPKFKILLFCWQILCHRISPIVSYNAQNSPATALIIGANTIATTLRSLIKMLMEGPAVSLKGSPTVSPTTAALWHSEPLAAQLARLYVFLALSQAPPLLLIIMAITKPDAAEPASHAPLCR